MFERLVRPSKEEKYDIHIPVLRPALCLPLRLLSDPVPGPLRPGRKDEQG